MTNAKMNQNGTISVQEKQQIIGWNGANLERLDTCIHHIIQSRALALPESEAVVSEEEGILTYNELENLADKVAVYLRTLGIGPEDIIPICFDKSMWNVVSILGVLKAGAAFLPLDYAAPVSRLENLAQNANARVLLCSQKQASLLASVAETVIPVDGKSIEQLAESTRIGEVAGATSKNLAYMIYTSGSTGTPKGTLVEHGAFCTGSRAHEASALLINSESRVLQFASHTFDASLVEILTTLMVGGVVCIPSEDSRLNDIEGAISRMRVNLAVLTPSIIGFITPSHVPSLKTLVLAGEAMSQTHLHTWSVDHNLINGYGPSEASVCCSANSHVTPSSLPNNIGYPVACNLWVVDPDDHNILMPLGCVGELLIQGSTLARGYLNDSTKTKASFIDPPIWAPDRSVRMYKTGDLVKQAADGSYHFVGRKDNQVKVHGQRVELGEVEHHINDAKSVKHGVVLLPRKGPLQGRLVSIISLSARSNNRNNNPLTLLDGPTSDTSSIRDLLSIRLPVYMVPSVFITVEDIPLLPSGKLDRKTISKWLEEMDNELYRCVIDINDPPGKDDNKSKTPSTEVESNLRQVWGHVLNLPIEKIDINRSFLSLGGDSISAMQVKSQCLKRDINVSVQDVLRSKSIVQLALCAKELEARTEYVEAIEQSFGLSPIQRMFFELPNQGRGHFNQSFFLRVTRRVQKKDLRQAIDTIVDRHSMLRARFTKTSSNDWTQRITNDVSGSYRLNSYNISNREEATPTIANSQASLDIMHGPIFSVDLFDVNEDNQLLFMVGHHLVIDLVSWRNILEELEDLLLYPNNVSIEKPLSFQTWCQLQLEHSQQISLDKVLPSDGPPVGNAEYWGISETANIYGDVTIESFELDSETTSMMLKECHDSLRTETIDILLAALLHSFACVFSDRSTPAVYNEGHGREPSGLPIDLSRTIGWFTIMYPVYVPASVSTSLVDTVRYVKDLRKKIPDNGRPYFATRCLTDAGSTRFGHHWPLELTFNYLGQYQQLEREGSLLAPVEDMAGESRSAGGIADYGKDTPRFGLFEISAVIAQGKLRFSFSFNKNMQKRDKITQWVSNCQHTISQMARALSALTPQLTLGDFPLLDLNYDGLDIMVNEKLPELGIHSLSDVEDIYPCSSMQEGLLISQNKDATYYAVQVICELKLHSDMISDSDRLARAWQKVCDRHASLRTVFVESVTTDDGLYDQVVVKTIDAEIVHMSCSSDKYALRVLAVKRPLNSRNGQPPHRFTICETAEKKILFKLEINHTIMDGGSMSIILRDLSLAYEGRLPDGNGPLYSDYISFLKSQPTDASLEYWKTYLSGVEPCNIPELNDGIKVAKELHSLRLDFSKSKFKELKLFCDEHGVTFSNALHAAWGLTLRCYADSDQVVFGYLTSGRDSSVPGIKDTVGPFINMLVCRMDMTGPNRLGAIIDQVQTDYMESLPHRYISLAEVQHALKLSGATLFNTCLSYQRLESELQSQDSKVSFEERVPIYDPTEYPLSINIVASDNEAILDLDYWTESISDGQAANIASTFTQSIENIIHNSQQNIGQLNYLGEYSRKQISIWNNNMPEAVESCVHNVIQAQAESQPTAPAIAAWDADITYVELEDLSTRLANHLKSLGVKPETFVPTCFDKSAWTIVAMIAVLKAGAAAVPLDANHPKSALELRVHDTRAEVVLAAPSRAHMFEDMGLTVISISREFIDSLDFTPRISENLVLPTNPCFVIFTSGSTGKPKGVVLEHGAIVTTARATGDVYEFGPQSRVLQFAAYTFDNSLAEIFITLMRGGCVCVPSETDRFNNLAEAINRLDVNFMDITPTVAGLLQPSQVPKVKGLSLGGEALTRENIDTWGNAVTLHCCYGPSECSINSVWNGDLLRSSEATNIGKSIGSVSWVVNPSDHNQLVPIGVAGELLIEGPILARGYLNDPEKTSKAFIMNPAWANGQGRRFYKTGDLVRQNSDGSLTYLGRKDTQIKLNGQRIELGEIEHHVKSSLPYDAQSAVELIKLGNTKALAAFLCLKSEASVLDDPLLLPMTDEIRSTATAIEAAVTSKLPTYMVPTIYIPVSKMPMTSSGKLDRLSLRKMCEHLSDKQTSMYRLARKSGRAPSTEMEKCLAMLWEEVLNLEENSVGADDNFFRLGGDSIGAMKLITAARLQGIALNVATVFSMPRLCDISLEATVTTNINDIDLKVEPFSLLENLESITKLKSEVANQCHLEIDFIDDILPCTAIQEGLVALSNKDAGAYVAQNIYTLPPGIDIDRFKAAWNRVFAHESILRTRIVYIESSGFLQVVVRESIDWQIATNIQEIIDLDRLLPAYNGAALSRYTILEAAEGPQFVWTAHHALYDGWCIPLMLAKVEACYHDQNAKLNAGATYPQFIKYLSGTNKVESDNFWRAKLSETTALQFPTLPHPSYQIHATTLSSHVAHVSREKGSQYTLPSTIRAAWALVIAAYSGSTDDVVFGETLTGRDAPIPGIVDMIGPTLATVPTRIRINYDHQVGRFLEDVQSLSAAAIPYQYAGLQNIKHINEDTRMACNFQNLLAIHHDSKEPEGFWNLRSSGTSGTNFYSYPLTMSCQIIESRVEIEAHYDKIVISKWQVERMLRQLEFVLELLNSSQNMDRKLSDLTMLNPVDRATIFTWNHEPLHPVNKCIHQLIEQQVCEQPESAVAVHSFDGKVTYRQLDRLSTRLAHYLLKLDMESRLIPLCFEKSGWTIVAMLGVLKSGFAFVPLDPKAPISRLRDLVADTKASLVLCSTENEKLCSKFAPASFTIDQLNIDNLPDMSQSSNGWDTLPKCDSQKAAYVIFTSGTTGKPKGTIVQHGAFCSGAAAHAPALRMQSTSRVLQFASYTFDASLLEILTALTIGATVVVPSEEDRMNNITKIINEMNVTWTLLTPSFIQLIQPSQVPMLRTLVLGGEAMSQNHISTWADKLELINAYGPSECAVVATANPRMTMATDPSNMGYAVGGRAWIADPRNHDRLTPVGSVGELIIEGPILAQGYLNNESKTAEVFIKNPKWSTTKSNTKMYKTGDLCKYAEDGSLIFCGRKDTQVKLHGQRLELGEVEHHLRIDPTVQHAFATIPKSGICKKRLVAVLSLKEQTTDSSSAKDFSIILPDASSYYLTGIRERLCDHLPAYMIPSQWLFVQKLPLLPSGKLDRRQIDNWVEDMNSEVYHQITDTKGESESTGHSLIESQLRTIWGKALNLPADKIGMHQSFLHLGGDSISAMQVMSSCRAQDLGITVQDIIQSKSITQLAQRVTLPEVTSHEDEMTDVPFDLSPIQKLYFECIGNNKNHFNQSVILRFSRKIEEDSVISALNAIVEAHSMLRARFTTNETGIWQQRVLSEVQSSYRYGTQITNMTNVSDVIERSQKGLDIQSGPVFAADLLNIQDENQQLILLVAHHLVIDVVSWRIILQDLEDILQSEKSITATSLPFQTWSRLQLEHTQQTVARNIFHPEDVPVADLAYWDMAGKANTYGDTIEDSFDIDPNTSLLLLGTCHSALNTDPVDIFLAAVMTSFRKVFSDRSSAPAIFNEGHGREPWNGSNIDLSQSVGWFTTMCPVYLPSSAEGETDLVNTIRWVKDLRRRIPDKGRPYFAYRLLTEEGAQQFPGHWPMEVTFNYLGKLQQLERPDALLKQVDGASNAEFDIGLDVPRFALFELSAQVVQGTIKFSFSYNKKMKRQAKIRRWVIECQKSLQDAALRLISMKPEQTLNDFPLLPLNYRGISKLIDILPQLGVSSLEDVSDVYPCSPMQQGMLIAQIKDPSLYTYSAVFETTSSAGVDIDARLLADSWQDVVDRHSTLRTIFIESIGKTTLMDQVVLKGGVARTAWLESPDADIFKTFAEQESINFRDKQPPHRFSFCKVDDGRVFCKLEISHTISDGTSIPILLRDLSQAYENKTNFPATARVMDKTVGRQALDSRKNSIVGSTPLPPLYSEYIAYIQSKASAEDLNYWKAYLSEVEPCNFPSLTDGIKMKKELQSLVLDLGQPSAIKNFCTKNGVTLSNILQLVWALVLRVYTGSTDVSFGYLSSGRDAPISGLQSLAVGAFINMLTCRMNLSEDLSVIGALEQIQTDFVQSMAHQACPLADVQHELQLSGTSLFNTAFTFQRRSTLKETVQSALEFKFMEAEDPSEYDVTVNVEALDTGIEIHFGYWTSVLSESQATNMSKTFQHVLNSIIDSQKPAQTIGDIDFFSQHSREQVMKWNNTMPAKVDRCVHIIIDEHSANRPISTPAIDAWDGQLTYRELENVTNRLAAKLVVLGIGPEIYVPLCFEKSIYTIISMVGVMKAGGAFVPLDPTHPQGRLKHFVEDVGANLVLCSNMHQEKISATAKQTLVVDKALIDSLDDMRLSSAVKPSNPAYIIFTSGTTGLPKGTIIEHSAFCTSATEHAKAMYMRSDSRVFQFASHTFDASVMEILSTLITGGCVCIPSDLERMDNIPGAIKRMGVTWTLLTPSVANTLSPKAVPTLKVLVTGGEAMSSGHIAKWKGKTCLINAYGPSETSVIASTSTKVDEDGNELSSDTSIIGRAVGGRNWVVDTRNYNKLVPVGGLGELIVEGHIVARGYLNNKAKTAQAFISNPAWLNTEHRLYRTGDLVRYCSDGTLAFVARKDTQIKLNGQRIELGEIEHQVKTHMPEDSQSAVELVSPNRIATKALAVFFCCPNATPSKHENEEILTGDDILLPMSGVTRRVAKSLDSSLAGVLPTYMIPTFYIPITKMPWTSSGKLDRIRLRNIVANLPKESTGPYRLMNIESKTTTSVPATDMEKKLQKLWESIMNVSNAGIDDNFFRLGGDSVLAMKLVSAARLEHISLSVVEIFRNPKLADMALVCGIYEEEAQVELPPFSMLKTDDIHPMLDEIAEQSKLQKDLILDAYPTSSLQEGLLTLSLRQPGAYVAHNVFQIPFDIDMNRFKLAWQKTVDEVDILRTRIVHLESGTFVQVVVKPEPISWKTAEKLEDVEAVMLPIHNGAELTQFTIIENNHSSDRFFIWSIHHGLYDGWSLPMVLSRVQSAYLDSTSSFPTTSYASFIKYVSDVDIHTSDEFWRTRLAGASPLQFPQKATNSDPNSMRNNQVINHNIAISNTTSMEVTLPTIIRAAWSLIVATYSGSNDVVFGETLAGRDIPVNGIADVIGPIFTTVPTRVIVDREANIGHFLNGIHGMATEIIPYQHAGLQRIKRLDSDTDLACDFQNLLVIQTAEEETEDEFWKMENSGVADNFFTYPLVLEVKSSVDSSKIDIIAHFDAEIISNWHVQRLLFQFEAVLRQLIFAQKSGLTEKVGDVQVFSPEDKQLLQDCNSRTPILLDSTIHEEFEKVAASQPHAPAVCSWDGEFTYKEVHENATRLSQHLISLGIGPDVFVPICMDKSAWAIISMLAIMIAGGAYSPLDPNAPMARHQEMINDLDADIILCTPKYAQRYSSVLNRVLSVDEPFVNSLPEIYNYPLHRATGDNPAYAIFTSGSSGKPKGCVILHRAICTSSVAMRDAMLMKKDSRVFQFASYTFDVSVLEIFTTLSYGGCVCVPSETARLGDIAGAISTLNVQWSFLTPSVANLLEPTNVLSLEVLVCGGEAMSIENVQKWAPHVTLVNGYGPTEASVIALSNNTVSQERNPANIGRALAGNHAWIADPSNHDRLAPVGCSGELLLEGPILAREYIKNPAKTTEAFIKNPAWASLFDDQITTRRLYATGDLVHYNEDLSISFIGRKDNQVKLNGQRMELGEIENVLDIDEQIKHALVALPKVGHFKKRLVAILSLVAISSEISSSDACQIVQEGPRGAKARKEVAKSRNRLSERLPAFMVPSTWIPVESIPLLPSGKLDRRGVLSWLEKIDEKTYETIMEADNDEDDTTPATETSLLLQQIFCRVLNIPLQRVKLSSSFLSVGGDSITAMQVMAMCRKEKMNFSLSEVLRSKSIHQLAASAKFESDRVFQDEKLEKQFDLSPIQQLYFQAKSADQQKSNSRFNQSFSLQISRRMEAEKVKASINTIVDQHSMLRAKFKRSTSGNWQQRITKDAATSYRFCVHNLDTANEVAAIVGNSQATLDIQAGPIFSVDLFNIAGEDQMLFLAAHHLVIDMVSWRIIIGDLEELLNSGKLTSEKPLSYQVWLTMQSDHSHALAANKSQNVLPFKVGPSRLDYWGMLDRVNTYSDVVSDSFTIDKKFTALAMGESNISLHTEPVELFLSAIAHSFSRVFIDRDSPALYNEGHGRESWDSGIDISRTVGWFTSIFPLQVDIDTEEDDVVDSVRRIKDFRRKVPDNGRPYFAQRFLTPEGRAQFKEHDGTMEVIFNYLGRMQQLEHDDSLLQQWTYPENEANETIVADVGPNAERFALFEISASIVRDELQFSFLYNKEMKHQKEIQRWIVECQTTLEETIQKLAAIKDEVNFTLSDFPLLPITYDGLEKITAKSLPQVGITPKMVEAIYPCAPLQEGLILSQIKDPSLYHFHAVFEVNPASDGKPIDAQKLMRAWQRVVDYHEALRTVFADSVYRGDIFNQIIVKQADSGAIAIRCDEADALKELSEISILDHNYKKQPRLPHQITVCQCLSGKVYFKAEINHGVIDGSSANIMLRDVAAAYHGTLPEAPGPSYGNYISHIKALQHGSGNLFWKKYLNGVRPCHFPKLNDEGSEKLLHSAAMDFDRFPELQAMCKKMKVTLANVMQAAWALCLRTYTKSEDICFGYLTSGRDVPVPQIQDTIGAFINMLVCRVKFSQQSTLKEVYQKVQQDYIESLEFQHTSLAQVQHDLTGGQPLFNTAVSIQKGAASDDARDSDTISFDPVAAHDPGEYAVTLNVRTYLNDEGMVLRYWTNFISDEQAALLASRMSKVLETFVNKPHQTVEELDLSEGYKPKSKPVEELTKTEPPEPSKIPALNSSEELRSIISETVREVIAQMFKSGSLVSYGQQDIQDTLNFVNRQIIQPQQPLQVNQPMIDYSQLTPPPNKPNITKPKRTISAEYMKTVLPHDDQVERKLLAIWSDLLQIPEETIRGDDSFFALGGDSIIAMQMVGIARDEDLALTVASIFRHPTFADMATVIRLADEANAPLDVIGPVDQEEVREIRAQKIQNALYQRYSLLEAANVDAFLQDNICPRVTTFRGGIVDVFPVTDFQALAITGTLMESKWMLNYFHLSGDGPVDLKKLKIGVYRLVDAFDILRTVFVPYANRFFQVVLRKLQPAFSIHDCDDLAEFTSSLQQSDRKSGPRLGESYLKFVIAKERGSLRHRIIIRMSHAQYDGVCMPTILAGLQRGYQSQAIPATPSFSGYVRDSARTTTDEHYSYWKKLLKGSSMTEVVRRRGPNYKRGGEVISLKRNVRFSSLASKAITPASIIKAAWSLVLATIAGSSDVTFGNVISGRNAAVLGIENIIGPCVNLVPVRVAFLSGWTVLDLLYHIQNQQVANMPYESLGFREIIKHCTDYPDWTNFSTVCQHQNIERQAQIDIGKIDYTLGALGSQEDFADITILSTPQEDDSIEINLIFTENSGITTEFAEDLFEELCNTSTAFSENPNTMLPSPSELSELPQQTLSDPTPMVDSSLSTNLRGISHDELLIYNDLLVRAWRQILWDRSGGVALIDFDSSFYKLGGDIIGVAQVASILEAEGFKLRVEDLVDHPLLVEQLALCAVFMKKKHEDEAKEMAELAVPEPEQLVTQKKGLKKVLGKTSGLKNIFKKKGKAVSEEQADASGA